jgi:dTDP-4-amino-4,6-dideoxygalactose transaminase
MAKSHDRIFLSPPDIGPAEQAFVAEAFATNWVAPLGPHVDAFEREFADVVKSPNAVALSSGTAALHLSLILEGVGPGDVVLVSTLTFSASVNPILYLGATPHFIDCDRDSWNMDPVLLAETLAHYAKKGIRPKAVIPVHLYGQTADMDPIMEASEHYGVPVIEDAAEALGSTYKGRAPGTFGQFGIFSFNGNKIITTAGGGMLVTPDASKAAHARKLSTQARERAPHYEHTEIGYNYRLSNILAGIGRGQLPTLETKVAARRRNFEFYQAALSDAPGVTFMPEAEWGRHNRWLTVLTIDESQAGTSAARIIAALEQENIEARPVWKPMHEQPVFKDYPVTGGRIAADLFCRGVCLPSGSSMTAGMLSRVVRILRRELQLQTSLQPTLV